MLEGQNNFTIAIDTNSEWQQNITENEWTKINSDKDKILSKISNLELKNEFEYKYEELDTYFKQEWEQNYKTTNDELRLFKNSFNSEVKKTNKELKNEFISKYSEQYKGLQIDIVDFLNISFNNWLSSELKDFNIDKFDKKDNIRWFTDYELMQYTQVLDKAMNQMNILGSFSDFKEKYTEIWKEPSFLSWKWDIALANKVDLQEYVFWKWEKHLTENLHNYSEEELYIMKEEKFDITDPNKMKNLIVLLWLEIWDWIEDMLKFLWNIPSWLILLPRYISNRSKLTDDKVNTKNEVESQMENDMILKGNPSLMLWELLWEKGIQMIKQLWEMMVSWKNWDIASLLVTIAWLFVWWAWAVKLWSKFVRRESLISARKAGRVWRINNKANELIKNWDFEWLLKDIEKYDNLNSSIAKELINKWYEKEVFNNITRFNIESIIDILPNSNKIIDFYREIKKEWKPRILEWNYWLYEKASGYKIWDKSANEIDWLLMTSNKLKEYSDEDLIKMWINVKDKEIMFQFNEYVDYVEKLENKVINIREWLKSNAIVFDKLLEDIWRESSVSKNWTDLSNKWEKTNWIHNKVPLKWIERLMEKVLEPWFFDWDINRLWDIIRWSLEYDNVSELYKWINSLMNNPILLEKWAEIFIKDSIWDFKWKARHFQDYRDVNCTIKMSDGSLAELQFHIKDVLQANNNWIDLTKWTLNKINFTKKDKEISWKWKPNIDIPIDDNWIIWHKIYELWRSIPNTTESEELLNLKNKFNNLLIEIHKQAWEKQFNT